MRLLIVTQKVDRDDSYFGFFHTWLVRFAETCESVTVIALERRVYELPDNVRVLTLGKESRRSRMRYLLTFWRYAWSLRNDYDAVFCHMSPLYVIAGFPLWKLAHKPVALWYVHRSVDLKLRIATRLADRIFTATPESLRLKTSKVRYMGQAVDTGMLAPQGAKPEDGILKILSVGRITPIKRLEMLINALALLREKGVNAQVTLIGAPLAAGDAAYEASLKERAERLGVSELITWAGPVPFARIREAYTNHDVSVNLAPTGGMDKVVLESYAAGTPAFVANHAFKELLEGYEDRLLVQDARDLADKLVVWNTAPDHADVEETLRKRVEERYSLATLVRAITRELEYLWH